MGAYIRGRLLRAIPLFLGLSLIIFALIHAAPGGPLTVYLSNPNVTPEDIARLERNLGLDRPLPVQYVSWLTAFMKGDWGYSYVDGRPVLERILERAPATLELMASAFVLALFVALLLGSVAALRPGSLIDCRAYVWWRGGVNEAIRCARFGACHRARSLCALAIALSS